MKVAVIGTGKTGTAVGEMVQSLGMTVVGPFNSSHKPRDHFSQLTTADVAVIFVPGEENLHLIDLLLEAKIPCVWGGTGFTFPSDTDRQLQEKSLTWIHGQNFSLLMPMIESLLNILGHYLAQELVPLNVELTEIHHKNKKDAPSGTALEWKKWLHLSSALPIHSKRTEDVTGIHQLVVRSNWEEITLKHQSYDRKLFASGAMWAANLLVNKQFSQSGLHSFNSVYKMMNSPS